MYQEFVQKHRASSREPVQRPTQPPTGGGLSWWLLPLRGGHGGGLRRFAAVMAEVFAPSWRSRRRSFYTNNKNMARFISDLRFFNRRSLLGVCAFLRYLHRQALLWTKSKINNPKQAKKIPPPTLLGNGGQRSPAVEVKAVFCGRGQWPCMSHGGRVRRPTAIWRLKRHNP